jgi:hypothetical protein
VQYHPPKTTTAAKAHLKLYAGKQAQDLLENGIDVEPLRSWQIATMNWQELQQGLNGAFDI